MDSTSIELTKIERKMLRAKLLGYGKLELSSRITGLHVNTLRMVNYRGTGSKETINAIRKKLLATEKVERISE